MQIVHIMTAKPHTIHPDATLFEAAEKMLSFGCGIFPVEDLTDIIGVLTDRDIVTRAIAKGKDVKTTLVKDIMTAHPFFCGEDDFLPSAIYKMNQNHTRRVLVKDKNNKLSGILSLGDIIRRMEDKALLAKLLAETPVG